jgi:hypothetical protein
VGKGRTPRGLSYWAEEKRSEVKRSEVKWSDCIKGQWKNNVNTVLRGDYCVGGRRGGRSMTYELLGESRYRLVHCTSKTKSVLWKNFFRFKLAKFT